MKISCDFISDFLKWWRMCHMWHIRASQKQREKKEILANLAHCGTLTHLIEDPCFIFCICGTGEIILQLVQGFVTSEVINDHRNHSRYRLSCDYDFACQGPWFEFYPGLVHLEGPG